MASWGDDGYLDQQRKRLPTHKFRWLHLNLPGATPAQGKRPEAILAKQKLERVLASLQAHRHPNQEALDLVTDALERIRTGELQNADDRGA